MSMQQNINAGIGNPISIANRYSNISITQTPEDLYYTATQVEEIQQMIKNYLKYLDPNFDETLYVIASEGGSTQLIAAFIWSIYDIERTHVTVKSAVKPPFYTLHQEITRSLKECSWVSSGKSTIEIVVSPNNPDGVLVQPSNTSKYTLLDSVYDVPQFSGLWSSVNPWKYKYRDKNNFCEVNSFSKIGFAGLRFGFAITSNKNLADRMQNYLAFDSLGLNTWTLKAFKSRYNDLFNDELYASIYKENIDRYNEISNLIPKRLIHSKSSVPFLFVRIPKEIFDRLNITIRNGEEFNEYNTYTRISLMISNEDWIELIKRLKTNTFKNYVKSIGDEVVPVQNNINNNTSSPFGLEYLLLK